MHGSKLRTVIPLYDSYLCTNACSYGLKFFQFSKWTVFCTQTAKMDVRSAVTLRQHYITSYTHWPPGLPWTPRGEEEEVSRGNLIGWAMMTATGNRVGCWHDGDRESCWLLAWREHKTTNAKGATANPFEDSETLFISFGVKEGDALADCYRPRRNAAHGVGFLCHMYTLSVELL